MGKDNKRNEEAGPLLSFGQCRDSARRCSLRQPDLSSVRDLAPRQAGLIGDSHARATKASPIGEQGAVANNLLSIAHVASSCMA